MTTAANTPHPETMDGVLKFVREMARRDAKIVAPNGIEDARYVELGGASQWITVRGQDRRAPMLLYLHGGPGGALSDISCVFQRPWEDYFTVVQWDQRGFGRSARDGAKLVGTLTKAQYIDDAHELIEHLCTTYGHSKLFVLGQSWGSALALEVARRCPERLYGVATIGQLVDQRLNFDETRRLLLEDARGRADHELIAMLDQLGPQPIADGAEPWTSWIAVVQGEMAMRGYSLRNATGAEDSLSHRAYAWRLISPWADIEVESHGDPFPGGAAAARSEVLRSISEFSVYRDIGTEFATPVLMMSGAHDWQTPVTLTRALFDAIRAPKKAYVEFPNSSHAVVMEEPGRLIVTLVQELLPWSRTQDQTSEVR